MDKIELANEFRKIGIQEGMAIEVHSSLNSFGYVSGGADAVIEALMECVGEDGSIFMPALRLSPPVERTQKDRDMGIHVKIKILPEDCPKTAMGVIADTFRARADVITSGGVFRTSGWGLHAEEVLSGGLNYVMQSGGKALLLGVDIYKLTAMHYVEDCLPDEIKKLFAPGEQVNRIYPTDEWLIEMGEPPVKPWYTIQNMAYEKGLIQAGLIGSCKYMFFDIWDIVSLYQNELEMHPFKLYGLEL